MKPIWREDREEAKNYSMSQSSDSNIEERLPVLGGHQLSQRSVASDRDYLMSLQSFRFCLRSLPLIKQLSASMIE